MKNSSSGSMSETYEVKALVPCNGNWNNILRNLYVDLFNLIVESRIPGINGRGYGNGYHCPPLLGQNVHLCDLMKPECRKHQTMIHHLLRAVRRNVFEIEVLVLPDCCSDSKLSERIQNKEYVLLERWSMTLFENDNSQYSIEISELLRAVRSFLHFSQISAWLSSTKGKSPTNIYYWVKPTSDPSSTQFESSPEVHSFPLFKVNEELCGTVRVSYPTRKQYIPIIPCSKHPPFQGLRLRLTEGSNLAPSISLDQQSVKQLQKNCDNQQSIIAVKHCATDTEPLKTNSATVLKTAIQNVSDIKKTNRILKHSNAQLAVKNVNGTVTNSCSAQICNKKDISSGSESVFFSNCQQINSKCSSQENVCFGKSSISTLLPKNESKLNKVLYPSFCESKSVPMETAHQHTSIPNVPKCSSVSTFSSSDMSNVSSNLLLSSVEPSQSSVSNMPHNNNSIWVTQKNSFQKSLKRKKFLGNEQHVIPNKKICAYNEKCVQEESFLNKLSSSCQNNTFNRSFKRKHHYSSLTSKKVSNSVSCVQIENFHKGELSCDELSDQDSSKSTSLDKTRIPSGRKMMGEKSKQVSENCLNQTWNDYSIVMPEYEKNPGLADTFLKHELVNLPEETGCKNQIVSKTSDPDNCFSCDCDNLVSAKSDSEASKQFISKLKLNYSSLLNSSYVAKESLKQHCKICPNANNKSVLNVKSNLQNYLQNISTDDVGGSVSSISKLCFTNISHKSGGSCIQNGRIKKKYINDFYKSCRFQKLDPYQSANICSLSHKQDKTVQLNKSPTTHSHLTNKKFPYSNISPRVSKHLLYEKICKREKKIKSRSRLKNGFKFDVKSTLLDLTNESGETDIQDQTVNGFSNKWTFAENHNSKIGFSNSLLREQPSTDNSLKSFSHDCVQEDRSQTSLVKSNNLMFNIPGSSRNIVATLKRVASPIAGKEPVLSCLSSCNVLPQKATPYLDCFPRHKLKFARGRKLLGNFEESILKGCLSPVSNVEGFHTEIGASGSFCPNHITLPADVSFYDMDNLYSGTSPYMAHVTLGDIEYYVPKKGAVQVTLFNPSETVVKMFVLNYDLSDMPPSCHTFIRQKTYYMPVGSTEDCPSSPKWLRFILHLRFASSKTGKLYLHKDFKIVVLNKSNDDAASEFSQEPRELRSFLHVPMNPTFSNF